MSENVDMRDEDGEGAAGGVTPWWELSGMERELAKYDQCEEPGDCDHDHDNAIEYFREQELDGLRAERDAATTRAETAERELARQREVNRDVAVQCMQAMERATTAKRELAEMRERIGEAKVEWYVRWPAAGGDYHYELCLDEADARESVPDGDEVCEVVSRIVGEWKAADDG